MFFFRVIKACPIFTGKIFWFESLTKRKQGIAKIKKRIPVGRNAADLLPIVTKGSTIRSPAMAPKYPSDTPYPEIIPTLDLRATFGNIPL